MGQPATPWGPYPWDPNNQGGVWPGQGGGQGGQQANPDDIGKPPGAAGTATATAGPPQAHYLSQKQQDAIINSIGGHQGWFVVGGAAVPQTQMVTNTITGKSQPQATGSYTISIADGKGNTDSVTIYPGAPDETGEQTWIPQKTPTELPKPANTQSRPNVSGPGGTTYVWDDKANGGAGGYVPGTSMGLPPGEKGTEGATRQNTVNGYQIQEVFRNGDWVPDNSVAPIPFTPEAKASAIKAGQTPIEGNTRMNTANGYAIREVFRGGQWVPDTSYAPTPWTPEAKASAIKAGEIPTEGKTRSNVQNGYAIQEVYRNGQWIPDTSIPPVPYTPEAAASAAKAAGQAKEGDTRDNVSGGFKIREIYKNGQWIPDTSVAPTQWTPEKPSVVNAPNNQLNVTTMDSKGNLSSQPNANFIPTSTAEVASRVAQLQQLALAQRDKLMAQAQSGAISQDQAGQQWDQWWAQNVEPQKATLDAAQRSAQQAEQMKQQEQQRANLATAQSAGTQAIQAMQAQLPYMVGPGFGKAMNDIAGAFASGKAPGNLDLGSAVTFQLPDINALAQQATNQALAHLSPTAAQNMGGATGVQAGPQMAQQPQNLDLSQALNSQNYKPTVTVAPDGTVRVQQNNGQPQQQPLPAAPSAVPGQNYGASTAYTGGVSPWNAQPGPAFQTQYKPLSEAVAPGQLM